jgi:hypothetical protein
MNIEPLQLGFLDLQGGKGVLVFSTILRFILISAICQEVNISLKSTIHHNILLHNYRNR